MNTKKLLAIVLVLCLAVALVACSSPATQAPAASGTATSAAPAATTAAAKASPEASAATTAATTATAAAADDSWTNVETNGYFTVGLDDSFPPMGYRDDTTNEIVGYDIDLAKAVAKELGVEVKFQPCASWSTVVQEMDRGDFDVIWNGFSVTPEREAVVDFSEPYIDNQMLVVVLKDSSVQTLADLAGKKAALQAGSSAEDALKAATEFNASLKEVVTFDDNAKAMLDLDRGSVDCVVLDRVVFSHYATTSPDTYRALDETLSSEQMAIGFRKGDDALREKIQTALDKVLASDEGLEISMTWFGEDVRIKK